MQEQNFKNSQTIHGQPTPLPYHSFKLILPAFPITVLSNPLFLSPQAQGLHTPTPAA